MICDTDEKEAQWQAFQRSPVPTFALVRFERWGLCDMLNTPALRLRIALAGWDLQLPRSASNGDSPSR